VAESRSQDHPGLAHTQGLARSAAGSYMQGRSAGLDSRTQARSEVRSRTLSAGWTVLVHCVDAHGEPRAGPSVLAVGAAEGSHLAEDSRLAGGSRLAAGSHFEGDRLVEPCWPAGASW